MRRLPVLLAALGLAAVSLAGCSAGSPPTCDRGEEDASLGSLVSVEGAVGEEPDVSVPTPFQADGAPFDDLTVGTGTTVVSEWQDVVLGLTIVDGNTGETLISQGYDDLTDVRPASQWYQAVPGFEAALTCATAGSRIVVGLDSDALGEGAATALKISDGASAVAVIDVRKVYLSAADGADQFVESHGLPTVVRAPSGQPGIIIPDNDPPSDTVVQVLKKGDGPVPGDDDTVRVNFTAVSWKDRTVTATSWGAEPKQVPLSAATDDPALKALKGQAVGSQILVVVPGDPTAAQDRGTQVFVIDILGIDGQEG